MIKSLIAFAFFSMLMSFTSKAIQEKPYFKHIDITFTSPQGCTFHVVGEASINVFRLRLTGFTGTITLGGPAGCPQGTFTISLVSFNYDNSDAGYIPGTEAMTLQFDTDEVCKISTVKFITDSPAQETQAACGTINNTKEVKALFINALKEGTCD